MSEPAFWRSGAAKTCRAVIVLNRGRFPGDFVHVQDAKTHRRFSVVASEITSYLPLGCRVTNLPKH